jgi:hypothetical protein
MKQALPIPKYLPNKETLVSFCLKLQTINMNSRGEAQYISSH